MNVDNSICCSIDEDINGVTFVNRYNQLYQKYTELYEKYQL